MGASDFSPLKAARGGYQIREATAQCATHGEFCGREYLDGEQVVRAPTPADCPECAADRARAQERAERQQAFDAALKAARIPARFLACSFDNFELTAANRNGFRIAKGFADLWPEQLETGQSLVLLGNIGTGKTHLAVATLKVALAAGGTGRYCTVMELLREVRATWKGHGDRTEQGIVDYFGGVHLLVLDEVGVQYNSEAERVLIFDVLNKRYERLRPTIVCGNVTADELKRAIDERSVDRLRENGGQAAVFLGESYRTAVP